MIRVARLASLALGAAGLVACTGGGTTAGPVTTASPATLPSPSTTVATSTSSAPPTTLSPRQRDDVDIRHLHDRFFAMVTAADDPPDPNDPAIAATTTGIQRQRSEEFARSLGAAGHRIVGDVTSRTVELRLVDPDHVRLVECSRFTSKRVDAAGQVVAVDAAGPRITGLLLLRTGDGWRVQDWLTGASKSCAF